MLHHQAPTRRFHDVRCGKLCEHEFVDVRTDRPVLPFVNVLAEPGETNTMTRGGRYRCTWCHRIIDLTIRARLALPEQPLDTRPIDPFGDWTRSGDRERRRDRRRPTQQPSIAAAAATV